MFCTNTPISEKSHDKAETIGYYSDYYVFLADDGSSPLVIPIDINWSPSADGYEVEYKAWYGTSMDWPISYQKKNIPSDQNKIPYEAFEHTNTDNFSFSNKERSIVAKIDGASEIKITIPDKKYWILAPLNSDIHETFAFKTSVDIEGENRSGWMLYERIRLKKDSNRTFEGFAAFYWIPLVVNGDLYHFMQHREEKTSVKWSMIHDKLTAETDDHFTLDIVELITDAKSKRTDIAKTVRILAPEWDLDISLTSTGEQVGHGKMFPKGLAYYRQSLLVSAAQSQDSGYGMMELILENDN